jgi:hypothetical protein
LPLIFENHTKDIGDFAPIEKLCSYVAKSPVFQVLTATELVDNLQAGKYFVRCNRARKQHDQSSEVPLARAG